jgi:hypothetical protein
VMCDYYHVCCMYYAHCGHGCCPRKVSCWGHDILHVTHPVSKVGEKVLMFCLQSFKLSRQGQKDSGGAPWISHGSQILALQQALHRCADMTPPTACRDLFKRSRANAPCVIFVDELDALGLKRAEGGKSQHQSSHHCVIHST